MPKILNRKRKQGASGWTNGDGTRKDGAPKNWPFGTVPPEYNTAQPLNRAARERLKPVVRDFGEPPV